MAAAIGAGLPIHEPTGNMVVDIGGGTTEVAVISLGGIVTATSMRVGGDELDEAIIQHVKKEYSLLLGERTAEAIKLAIGSVFPMPEELIAEIKGRDLVSGLPKTITITAEEIRRAIEEPVNAIIDVDQDHAGPHPPGACRRHHGPRHRPDRRRRVAAGPGQAAQARDRHAGPHRRQAVACVVIGSGKCLEEFEVLKRVLVSSEQPAVTRACPPGGLPQRASARRRAGRRLARDHHARLPPGGRRAAGQHGSCGEDLHGAHAAGGDERTAGGRLLLRAGAPARAMARENQDLKRAGGRPARPGSRRRATSG